MPLRTRLFNMFNWVGGINTSLNEGMIAPNQLIKAENVEFGTRGAKKKRRGIDFGFSDGTITYTFATSDVNITTNKITETSHVFENNDLVVFTSTGTLPGGLTANTIYYIVNKGTNDYQVSTSKGGSAVDITSTGSGTHSVHNATQFICGKDFWFGTTSKTQRYVLVGNNGRFYSSTSSGSVTDITGTAWGASSNPLPNTAALEVMENLIIITGSGSGNDVTKWTGSSTTAALGGTPPSASLCRLHLGRLWLNDKTNPERLHFSSTGNAEEWNGAGDSGALDIGSGDGDPSGITAIFPSYKGDLFVAKRTRLYRITGNSPETFQIILVSTGLGCISHNSVVSVDDTDIFFLSDRGIHSLQTTLNYGDYLTSYVSVDIQKTINDSWPLASRDQASAVWLPSLNSYAIALEDTNYSLTSDLFTVDGPTSNEYNNAIWLYNIPQKSWYVWPGISCGCLFIGNDSAANHLYLGTWRKQLGQALTTNTVDTSITGTDVEIVMNLETGQIYFDSNVNSQKALKKFSLYYVADGSHNIVSELIVDGMEPNSTTGENYFVFSNTSGGETLGSDFVLGTSILGGQPQVESHTRTTLGYGKGIKLRFNVSGLENDPEIQGFGIEYEDAQDRQEQGSERA